MGEIWGDHAVDDHGVVRAFRPTHALLVRIRVSVRDRDRGRGRDRVRVRVRTSASATMSCSPITRP